MSILIDELEHEHEVVMGLLERLQGAEVESKETQQIISSMKTALLAHFEKEDAKLYPTLRKAAKKSKELTNILSLFAREMDMVEQAASQFLDKYFQGGDQSDFCRDLGKFTVAIRKRINREEYVLYRKYDQAA